MINTIDIAEMICEEFGWTLECYCDDQDGSDELTITFRKKSPLMHDFGFDISLSRESITLGDIGDAIFDYVMNFYADDEALLWLNDPVVKQNGISRVIEDFRWCEDQMRFLSIEFACTSASDDLNKTSSESTRAKIRAEADRVRSTYSVCVKNIKIKMPDGTEESAGMLLSSIQESEFDNLHSGIRNNILDRITIPAEVDKDLVKVLYDIDVKRKCL